MRFGIFLQPVHHPTENPTLALERDLELIAHLDRLGYDEAWVGEHHSTGWENIAAPDVFIAAAAERTKTIRLGTGVVQLGLHHPLIALDRAIFLDHLTRGRSMFGVGVGGGLPSDLKVFGLSPEDAGRRLADSLDVMERLLFEEEPVSEKTDWFELHEAVLQISPYTKPHMPMAVASTNPRNIETMGRLGGTVLAGPVPGKVDEIYSHLQRGAEQAGRSASRDQIVLSYAMHVAEDRDEAIESFKRGAITEHYELNVAVNGRPRPPGDPEQWYSGYVKQNMIGSVEDVTDKIDGLIEETGGFGGILFTSRDWPGTGPALRSWEIFARQVAPVFGGHTESQHRAARAAAAHNLVMPGD